jgi:hypothetical protein
VPELMVDLIVSLDGCAAADGWRGLGGMRGPDHHAFLGEQEQPEATAVLDHPPLS